jgi:hypothetical protein
MKALSRLLLLCLLVPAAHADGPPLFSVTGLHGWEPEGMLNRKRTDYDLVQDAGARVVSAQCRDSASMLGWAGSVDLRMTPVLHWRWKVERVYAGLDERVKAGSDFPARIYVVQGSRWMPWSLKTLIYVWSNGEYKAASWTSPYAGAMGQALIVPVRSGAEGVGRWQDEWHDVQADFRRFFGTQVDKIGALALMTDCDDSHSQSHAWYGDLEFVPRRETSAGIVPPATAPTD